MNYLIEKFPGDVAWAWFGFFVGVLLPVRDWFDLPYKLWIVITCFIAIGCMALSDRGAKTFGFDFDRNKWVINQIRSSQIDKGKLSIFVLTAISHFIPGIWFGQVVNIILIQL